jgi:hypothetical protein
VNDDDGEAVAEFIRTKGITRCPTARVLPTQALLAAADGQALSRHMSEASFYPQAATQERQKARERSDERGAS